MRCLRLTAIVAGWVVFSSTNAQINDQIRLVQPAEYGENGYDLLLEIRDPTPINSKDWQFESNQTPCETSLDSVYKRDLPTGTNFLILVENCGFPEYQESLRAFQEIVGLGLESSFGDGDTVFVAEFDWYNSSNPAIQNLSRGLTSSQDVVTFIESIEPQGRPSRLHHATELVKAMDEGVSFLANLPSKNSASALFILSREVQNIHSSPNWGDLSDKAQKSDVVIHSIGIPPRSGEMRAKDVIKLEDLCHVTFGNRMVIDKDLNAKKENQNLQAQFASVAERSVGWRYRWKVKLDDVNPDESYLVTIQAGRYEGQTELNGPSFWDWLLNDPMRKQYLIIGVVAFLVVTLGIGLLVKQSSKKKRAKKEAEHQEQIQAVEHKASAMEAKLEAHRLQEETVEKERKAQAASASKAATQSKQQELFRALRNRPILMVEGGSNHALNQLLTVIGRTSKASLKLDDPSVSKEHAAIAFGLPYGQEDGVPSSVFFISDLGSTNGTNVNGKLLTREAIPLQNNDIILIGNMKLIFRA